ncbi:hypothetical protein QBC35DRAFT_378029 [Podospora australis]|uniref:AMP-activated protein kinase glycogen-binding domain-containing protein n=1 Tax=Podospora australis TaxID=1536484 RepID=A0AAN7AIW6_9PEZI|nr:hypothetical protein QBC35DRAFT_378029 [Podospora australis]
MTSDEISAEITYQKPGTQPPIFVAGTFSDPPWHPYEMDYVLREDGEHLFRKEVYGKPGSEVQYKFRIGEGDWWDLQQGAPTEIRLARSDAGTPEPAKVAAESESIRNEQIGLERSGAGTPETAKVAAEVADSAELLHEDVPEHGGIHVDISPEPVKPSGTPLRSILLASPPLEESQPFSPSEEPEAYLEHKPPLFAHELAGVPSPDGEIREPELEEEHYHADRSPIEDIDPDEVDLNDPTLERFPSNREEIIEKVRKLETSLTEDQPSFEGAPPSPNTPAVPRQPLKHLDVLKSSHGSAVSLQSISEAEEPEEPVTEDDAATQPAIVFTNTLKPKPGPLTLDESHEDEGISLKDSVSPRTAAPPPAATMVAPEDTPSAREAEPVSETETTPTEQQRDANGADNKEPSAPEEQAAPAPEVAAPDQFDDVGRAGKGSPEVQITGDSSAEPSARATGADVDGEPQQARKRTTQPAEDVQTATSPVSTRSTETTGAIQPHRAEGWFRAFFRVLFVDWIGGFISKMYGGTRRNTT